MKKIAFVLIFVLFISVLPQWAQDVAVAKGKELGTIISTVIGIILPPLQPVIKLIFPDPASKDSDTVKISKGELHRQLDIAKAKMVTEMKATVEPVLQIIQEVEVLRSILKPCIEIQDYLREISVLTAKYRIAEEDWKRVQALWPQMKERVKFIADDKNCNVNPIRSRDVKDDLTRIIEVGKSSKLERIEIDFINLDTLAINSGDNATRFRIAISNMLELYQTVQTILVLSLQELQADFAGAYAALSLQEAQKPEKFQKGDKSLNDTLGIDPFHVKIMQGLDGVLMQQKIMQRLDEVLKKMPDKKK